MTIKVYDENPYQDELSAVVTGCTKTADGFLVTLDKTIFFARGGGQPCDGGTLGGHDVLDAYEEHGEVQHLLPAPLEPGATVRGLIDARTRFAHMQQHLGQHIMSTMIEDLFQNDTVIARIERDGAHIELERPLTDDELLRAQRETNRIIAENRPVRCFYTTPEQAATLHVRGRLTPHESVRLVEIEGFDLNGCGGTHCRSTGEVGQFLVTGTESVRGVYRVHYACGVRAEAVLEARTAALLRMQRAAGVYTLSDFEQAVRQTAERRDTLEAACRELREALVLSDAERYALGGRQAGGRLFAAHELEQADVKHLKTVCDTICRARDAVVLFSCTHDGQISLQFSRSKGAGPDLGAHVKALLARFEGRGGGSQIAAQGMMPYSDDAIRAVRETFALLERACAAE